MKNTRLSFLLFCILSLSVVAQTPEENHAKSVEIARLVIAVRARLRDAPDAFSQRIANLTGESWVEEAKALDEAYKNTPSDHPLRDALSRAHTSLSVTGGGWQKAEFSESAEDLRQLRFLKDHERNLNLLTDVVDLAKITTGGLDE